MPTDLREPLPEPGDWDGPVFGRLGVLATDGQRVECHACGRWFHHLGHHVRQTHNLTADEYRALFGLNVRTGLVGPDLAAGMRARAVRLKPYHALGADVLRSFTPEQMSAYQRGRSRRLETRIKPRNVALRQLALDKAQTRVAELRAAGVVLYRPTHEGVAWGHRVQERLRIHRQDPEFDAAWRRAISEGRGGKATLNCAICGAPFQVQPSRAKERKLCSKACRSEFCRRKLALARERPGAREKAAATRRANPAFRERMRAVNAARAVARGARPDGTVDVSCAVCGAVFSTKLWTGRTRKTCSDACFRELRSRNARRSASAEPPTCGQATSHPRVN